ncbi:uncharacterized protein LOC112463769 [Temnothorax curvispinosus]|uniref:Uncharacterized protein LOC112463769 n=1 Tax=Temnothorax curvispinosus TaxID=300111 RepID=A0A6J1QYZ4_9HYME|nr:uncharacterized protein LOC112463769 [Temnothorax curvispinosus]
MESRTCVKCKKSIANQVLECLVCKRVFHPGCIKAHAATKYADTCCRALSASLGAPPSPAIDVHAFDFSGGSSCAPMQTQVQARVQSHDHASIDVMFRKLCEQLRDSDAKLSAFVEEQRRTNKEINDKLNRLGLIADTVALNTQRIDKLEQESSALARDVQALKAAQLVPCAREDTERDLSAALRVPRTSDLIISGIPSSVTESSCELVECVFRALGIPQLVSDVLETRDVATRVASSDHDAASASASAPAVDRADVRDRRKPIIVALKSREIRDHIIKVMRVRRRLPVSDVFSTSRPGNIYINELLPSHTYKLLRQAQVGAKQLSFGHVWSSDGRVFVRKDRGQPPIPIASEADLDRLQ